MTWVAWRQIRLEMIIAVAAMVSLAALFVPTGIQKHTLFNDLGLNTCLADSSSECGKSMDAFIAGYGWLNAAVTWLNFVPLIIGVLFAAPIVVEFERRTHRLAWTQSISRGRWLAVKIVIALAGIAAFTIVLSLLMTWWFEPRERVLGPFDQGFDFTGIAPFAHAVFAFAFALVMGTLVRRTAVAATLAIVVYIAAAVLTQGVLRKSYMPPVELGERSDRALEGAWVIGAYGDAITFHPADRFWAFQAIEAAIFLGMAAMLMALTVWVVSKRMR